MPQLRTSSYFLNLPFELIFQISNYLPRVDRAVLATICRSLRAILGTLEVHRLSSGQYLRFLTRIARDLLDWWVCEACFKLHPVSFDDTPKTPWKMSCPIPWDRWCNEVYGRRSRHDHRAVQIEHRHVQLALKYIRLQNPGLRYQYYYSALLAVHRDDHFRTHPFPVDRENVLDVSYVATPKIIKDRDGNFRYLLMSAWEYRKKSIDISLPTVGEIILCPHNIVSANLTVASTYRSFYLNLEQLIFNGAVFATHAGGCRHCPTDIFIKFHAEYIIVQTWQDMGTKGSPGK
ncbi:uncharacterized protein F4812DRAFT_105919 [Daldinia caldariorum]|uniref:uncharacterized protein n=1 Tax=Daldinia caldariorum TaxID=326644 RepID=UPI0020084B9B|nr:uncharacterized protein F4812DRAFT_105919 [Daldinia caldariorum]KAI1465670.1 hypothetical protein F4812DRAFT_105919 [Daldinia caldariorum]